jgi:hypothetical protein
MAASFSIFFFSYNSYSVRCVSRLPRQWCAVTWPLLRSRPSRARTDDHCWRLLTVYRNVGAKFVVHFLGSTVPLPIQSFGPAALSKSMEHYGVEYSSRNQQPLSTLWSPGLKHRAFWLRKFRRIYYPEDESIRYVRNIVNHLQSLLLVLQFPCQLSLLLLLLLLLLVLNCPNPSGRTMALGWTQPLTEMSTRNL